MKKKICIITAARSEYGLLRWLIEELRQNTDIVLQLVVTGSHLSPEYGETYKAIEEDGCDITAKVEMLLSSATAIGIAKSMGVGALGLADVLETLRPDLLVVLGDRYELLPICSTALVMRIPIAHISGGDITEGAIDNKVRNAVTMLADIHFPGTQDSGDRIISMGIDKSQVHVVGEPGLESFLRFELYSRKWLSDSLGIDMNKKWILLTYHPETLCSMAENMERAENIVSVLSEIKDLEVVITKANADLGGIEINRYFETVTALNPGFKLIDNLGHHRYLSIMKEVDVVIGNSSSGIVEAPFLKKAVINIGKRQAGRYMCENIVQADGSRESLVKALQMVSSGFFRENLSNVYSYYGDGNTACKIASGIRNFLLGM